MRKYNADISGRSNKTIKIAARRLFETAKKIHTIYKNLTRKWTDSQAQKPPDYPFNPTI